MLKILVALDPFTKADGKAKRAMQTIRVFANQLEAKLQAAAVVSPDQLKLPLDFEANIAEEYLIAAEKNLKEKQNQLKVRFDQPPEVAVQPYRSSKRSIEAIINIAKQTDADFLAVLTHVKKKPTVALFGFVETLVSLSTKPVLAVSANSDLVRKVDCIVFASDFSNQCKQAFIETLDLARTLGARIVVAHKGIGVENPSPFVQAYDLLLKDERERINNCILVWQDLAELQNVAVEFVVSKSASRTGDAIVQIAKSKRAQLIVVVSQSGKYESLILGSVTRRLLQIAKVPVLIIRENSLRKGKKNEKRKANNSAVYDNKTNNSAAERNDRTRTSNY